MKKYLVILALAFASITNSQAQLTSVMGMTGVEDLFARKFVCVLYKPDNTVMGVLNSKLQLVPFDENKIDTYYRFNLETKVNNSLLLSSDKGYVVRTQGNIRFVPESDYKKSFERKEDPAAGVVYKIGDDSVREKYYFRITDKGKESGYITLEKPMMYKAKLRLYMVE